MPSSLLTLLEMQSPSLSNISFRSDPTHRQTNHLHIVFHITAREFKQKLTVSLEHKRSKLNKRTPRHPRSMSGKPSFEVSSCISNGRIKEDVWNNAAHKGPFQQRVGMQKGPSYYSSYPPMIPREVMRDMD